MAIAEHSIAPEQIQSYVDRELTAEESAAVEAHVASCDECRALASSSESISETLRQWSVEDSPKTLHVGAQTVGTSTPVWRRAEWLASAAALLFLAVAFLSRPTTQFSQFYGFTGDAQERSHALAELSPSEPEEPSQKQTARAQGQGQGQAGAGDYAKVAPAPVMTPRPLESPVSQSQGQQGQREFRGQQAQGQLGRLQPREPMVVRTVTLSLVTRGFDEVRPSLDRILAQAGGFVGTLEASAARGDARWLRGTVRVPAAQLTMTLDAVKKLGTVLSESQSGEDVTDQATDLDARLANARETEKRLVQVLQQNTGRVRDILEVEREIARVREEIERMTAERANLADRVSYATITLDIREEQKASLHLDPPSAGGRLRNAFVEGVAAAIESALTATALLVRVAPTLLLWSLILAWPAIVAARRVRALL